MSSFERSTISPADDHGLRWRYIPQGTFGMGSEDGNSDERPVHEVDLFGYWIMDAPISWASYCELRGWAPPPNGAPHNDDPDAFPLLLDNQIRLQYCEDLTLGAIDWHAHAAPGPTPSEQEDPVATLFGRPPREKSEAPRQFHDKPAVCFGWRDARALGAELTTAAIQIDLPTEAQWERAARGFHRAARYPWGKASITKERCDFGAFREFRIRRSRDLPPNDYGLYAMVGGVWEWCLDRYSSEFYGRSPRDNPVCNSADEAAAHVLRGGSWADCAQACTVSFRMAYPESQEPRDADGVRCPNIGFRLVLRERSEADR